MNVILFYPATWVHSILENNSKDISDAAKLVKELVQCSMVWGTSGEPCQDHI